MGITGASAQSNKYDLNGDGNVNVTDVTELVNYILGNQHEAVDLGLPSGTKWASCNIGATKPKEMGDYYAWGETEKKKKFSWENYIHCDGSSETCHNLGSDISGTKYDVAHVKWGGKWCMPTSDDIRELFEYCDFNWIIDENCLKLTSNINGNSIFLPGVMSGSSSYYYWSSTQYPDHNYGAFILVFSDVFFDYSGYTDRCNGLLVRPVLKK